MKRDGQDPDRSPFKVPVTVLDWSHPPRENSYSQCRWLKSGAHRENNMLCDVSTFDLEDNAVRSATPNDVDGRHGCCEVDGFIHVLRDTCARGKGKPDRAPTRHSLRNDQARWCSMAYRVAAPREETPILLKIEVRCVLTVRGLITSRSATCSFVSPCATRRNTSTSRAVSPSG